MGKNRAKRTGGVLLSARSELLEGRTLFSTLTVGVGAAYQTIQSAVDAAQPADTIVVWPGTYSEQVSIPVNLFNLTIEAESPQASPASVALPPGASIATINSLLRESVNASILQAPAQMTAPKAILEDDANDVHITGLIIRGPGGGTSDSLEFGVLINHATGVEIDHTWVRDIHDKPASAAQTGIGIQVQQGGSANIHDNFIDDYQESGVVITGPGSNATVSSNLVVGDGPAALLAQNGIEIDDGASGIVESNTVTANATNLASDPAAGILAYQSGSSTTGVTINYNIAYNNDDDILLSGSNAAGISGNTTYDASFDGISLFNTTNANVDVNVSHDNQLAGLFVDASSSNNQVGNNQFLHNNIAGTSWDIQDDSYQQSAQPAGAYGTNNFYPNDTFGSSNFPVPAPAGSIFGPEAAPPVYYQNVPDPQITAAGGVEVGVKFRSDVAEVVTGIRFYKGSLDTGQHSGELWSSTGQLLASSLLNVGSETASGWQQVSFLYPVAISADTTYIVSYHTSAGYIAYTPYAFSNSGIDNGPLHILASGMDGANGVYQYDFRPGTPLFPDTDNGQSPNYWVDVTLGYTPAPPASIFAASAAPAPEFQNIADPLITAFGGVEVGTKFSTQTPGLVTGVEFYKGSLDTGQHSGELWSSTGQLLASVTFSNETASGWQQATFTNAVPIVNNQTYIISYFTTAGYIAYAPNALANAGIDNGYLHILGSSAASGGNGVYSYRGLLPGQSLFPTAYNGQSPNYWVDVMFTPA